jgi:hypothetical protein
MSIGSVPDTVAAFTARDVTPWMRLAPAELCATACPSPRNRAAAKREVSSCRCSGHADGADRLRCHEAGKYLRIYSSRHHARKRRATASPEQLRSLPDTFARGDGGDETRRVVPGRWGHRRTATLQTRLARTRLRHPLNAAAS